MTNWSLNKDPDFVNSVQELRDWFYEQEPLMQNAHSWAFKQFKKYKPGVIPEDATEYSDYLELFEQPEHSLFWELLNQYLVSAVQELTMQVIDNTRN